MIENDPTPATDSELEALASGFDDQLPSENLQDAADDLRLGWGTYSIGTDPGFDENETELDDYAPAWYPSED
jgi:hypothetical protein